MKLYKVGSEYFPNFNEAHTFYRALKNKNRLGQEAITVESDTPVERVRSNHKSAKDVSRFVCDLLNSK